MTELRINLAAFQRRVKARREEWVDGEAERGLWDSYSEFLHAEMATERFFWQPKPAPTRASLRDDLRSKARAAYTNGATDKQIDFIMSLCDRLGRYDMTISGGHFTKRDASAVIDTLKTDIEKEKN